MREGPSPKNSWAIQYGLEGKEKKEKIPQNWVGKNGRIVMVELGRM